MRHLGLIISFWLAGCSGSLTLRGLPFGGARQGGGQASTAAPQPAPTAAIPAPAASPPPTSSAAVASPAPAAPAPAAEVAKAPTTLDVWLVDTMGKDDRLLPARLDRVEDLTALWKAVDRRWMVHTTRPLVDDVSYCVHLWVEPRECFRLVPSVERAELGENNVATARPAALWWQPGDQPTVEYAPFEGGGFAPLAAGTPGFILWGVKGHGNQRVYLLALDGGIYDVPLDALALGTPPARTWPTSVQHVLVDHAVVLGSFSDAIPIAVPPAVRKDFSARYDRLMACGRRAWTPAEAAFRKNDVANITESTRQNRAAQIEEHFVASSRKACRGALVDLAKGYGRLLDSRRVDRGRIYAAARQQFGG